MFLTADSSLGNYGYSEWHSIKEKESRHTSNSYHQQAVLEAYGVIKKFENLTSTMKTIMDENLKQRYQVYSKVVEALVPVVHLLGKQRLVLRIMEYLWSL